MLECTLCGRGQRGKVPLTLNCSFSFVADQATCGFHSTTFVESSLRFLNFLFVFVFKV